MPEEARDGFVFFRSYYEGAKELNDEQRLAFYDAIIDYALNDIEPNVSGVPKSCFSFVKPILDKSRAKSAAGKKGGSSKRQANTKQTGSKPEANSKQTPSKPEANANECEAIKNKELRIKNVECRKEYISPPNPPEGEHVGQPPETQHSEEEPPKPRRRNPSTLSKTQETMFNRFWAVYPRKVSIADAEKAWAKIAPNEELADTIVAAVETAKQFDTRFRDPRYIPHPASWLNAQSWRNEYDKTPAAQPYASRSATRPNALDILNGMLTEGRQLE